VGNVDSQLIEDRLLKSTDHWLRATKRGKGDDPTSYLRSQRLVRDKSIFGRLDVAHNVVDNILGNVLWSRQYYALCKMQLKPRACCPCA
jgi:hypothetical protein